MDDLGFYHSALGDAVTPVSGMVLHLSAGSWRGLSEFLLGHGAWKCTFESMLERCGWLGTG